MKFRILVKRLARFLSREDGPTAVEYAVLLALIITVCIAAITQLGGNANSTFAMVAGSTGGSSGALNGTWSGSGSDSLSINGSTYSVDNGLTTGTLTQTGADTYNFSDGVRSGTATVNGNTISWHGNDGFNETFTKN